MKKISHILYSFLKRVITPSLSRRVWGGSFLLLLSACTPHPTDVQKSEELPPIYPDYVDVTIPKNIAPLNFFNISSKIYLSHLECFTVYFQDISTTLGISVYATNRNYSDRRE